MHKILQSFKILQNFKILQSFKLIKRYLKFVPFQPLQDFFKKSGAIKYFYVNFLIHNFCFTNFKWRE